MTSDAAAPLDLRRAWPHLGLIPITGGGWGTGFVVCGDRALTARHVVASRRSVTFRMASGDYEADVRFSYTEIDLAVLQLKPRVDQQLPKLPPLQLASVRLPVNFVAWGYGVPTAETPRLVLGDGSARAFSPPVYQLQYTDDVLLQGMSGGPVAVDVTLDDGRSPNESPGAGIRVFAVIEGAYTSRKTEPQFRIGFATAVDAFPADLLRELGGNPEPLELRFEQEERRHVRTLMNGTFASLGVAALAALGAILGVIPLTPAIGLLALCFSSAAAFHLSAKAARETVAQVRTKLRNPEGP